MDVNAKKGILAGARMTDVQLARWLLDQAAQSTSWGQAAALSEAASRINTDAWRDWVRLNSTGLAA